MLSESHSLRVRFLAPCFLWDFGGPATGCGLLGAAPFFIPNLPTKRKSGNEKMISIFFKCSGSKKPNCKCQGFSLVEVSLAILIIGIGMLSVLSMFTSGLDQNKRSIDDTKAAFFAEEVFNGLLAASEGDLVKDKISWSAIGVSITNLIIAAESTWGNPPETLDVIMDNKIHTNIYRVSNDTNIVNQSFRYSLNIERKDRCTKSATLCVYPGEYGSTNNPYVFFMSIFNYQLQNP